MADVDKTLGILVKIGVIGPEDLEKARKAIADFSDEAEKSGEHAGGAEIKTRELHEAMRKLNEIVPGAGQALKLAFHPDEIGIVGLIVAFETLKSVLESIKAVDEIKLANFTGTKDAVDAVRDSYEKADVAARMFVEDNLRANAAGESAADVAKRQIEGYKNLASAQENYNTARKNLGDAQIDEQEKNGLITHEQALQQKFALDVEYTKKKLALDAATAAQELDAKKQQLATEQQQLATAQGDLKTDEGNAKAANAAKVKHDREKDAAKQNIDDAQKTLDELGKSHGSLIEGKVNDETVQQLKEYYEKYVGGDSSKVNLSDQFLQLQDKMKSLGNGASWDLGLTNFMDRTIGSQGGPEELAKYQGAKQQQAAAQKQLKALEDSQFQVDLNAERGKKQLDATEDSIRSLSKSVNELTAQIPRQAADNAAHNANAAGVANLNLRTEAIKNGLPDPGNTFVAPSAPVASTATPPGAPATAGPQASAGDVIGRGVSAMDDVQGNLRNGISKVSAADRLAITGMNDLLASIGGNQTEIIKILAAHTQNHTSAASAIDQIARQVAMLTAQNQHAGTTIGINF